MQEPGSDNPGNADEVRQFADQVMTTLSGLLDAIIEETKAVRAGNLSAAAELAPRKRDLAEIYIRDFPRLSDTLALLNEEDPGEVAKLRNAHDTLKAELKINLAVLATARQVAEDILSNVADTVGAETRPSTYGAAGDMAGGSDGARGLALNTTL